MDYPIRDRELALAKEVGIRWVRSDYDFGTAFGNVHDFHPQVFDDVATSCLEYDQQFLAILTWLGKMPWDDSQYGAFLDSLARRYDGKVTHWEMMNEVNLTRNVDSLPARYASALRVASEHLHQINPNNKVLLSGLAEVKDDFLEQLCRMGAMKWVDVMNFHSYFRPEELIQCFSKIRSLMDKYGWQKPVWLTECGMHTSAEKYPASGFYLDLLPAAFRRLNIPLDKVCVGYLADRSSGYVTLSHREAQAYLSPVAHNVIPVSLSQ
ncbi:MAG: glycosyl hydrolase, partial [Bacteroidaceae bacterium]|nr:glycosyl hydrolase [Bacteroidaceae bacterium]